MSRETQEKIINDAKTAIQHHDLAALEKSLNATYVTLDKEEKYIGLAESFDLLLDAIEKNNISAASLLCCTHKQISGAHAITPPTTIHDILLYVLTEGRNFFKIVYTKAAAEKHTFFLNFAEEKLNQVDEKEKKELSEFIKKDRALIKRSLAIFKAKEAQCIIKPTLTELQNLEKVLTENYNDKQFFNESLAKIKKEIENLKKIASIDSTNDAIHEAKKIMGAVIKEIDGK